MCKAVTDISRCRNYETCQGVKIGLTVQQTCDEVDEKKLAYGGCGKVDGDTWYLPGYICPPCQRYANEMIIASLHQQQKKYAPS